MAKPIFILVLTAYCFVAMITMYYYFNERPILVDQVNALRQELYTCTENGDRTNPDQVVSYEEWIVNARN